jgi:hypothetical protein
MDCNILYNSLIEKYKFFRFFPKDEITPELIKFALCKNYINIYCVPEDARMYIKNETWIEEIKKDIRYLRIIPTHLKNKKICLYTIKYHNFKYLGHVPNFLKTKNMCILCASFPDSTFFIRHIPREFLKDKIFINLTRLWKPLFFDDLFILGKEKKLLKRKLSYSIF